MTMTSVVWSAVMWPDSDAVMVRRKETLLPVWAGIASNANTVAESVITQWLGEEANSLDGTTWTEWFSDDGIADVAVILHEPAEIAGRYVVTCERVIKGRARIMTEREAAELDDMTAEEPL